MLGSASEFNVFERKIFTITLLIALLYRTGNWGSEKLCLLIDLVRSKLEASSSWLQIRAPAQCLPCPSIQGPASSFHHNVHIHTCSLEIPYLKYILPLLFSKNSVFTLEPTSKSYSIETGTTTNHFIKESRAEIPHQWTEVWVFCVIASDPYHPW